MTTKIITPSEQYDTLLPQVLKNRAAVIGQRKIKDGTTTYLKPLSSQINAAGNFTTEGGNAIAEAQRIVGKPAEDLTPSEKNMLDKAKKALDLYDQGLLRFIEHILF